MKSLPPAILTIAGSDSGAGAGIQADCRTVQALGGYGACAITAVTAQNGEGIRAWKAVAPHLVGEQIAAVLEGLPVGAVKTGLLPGAAVIKEVSRRLAKSRLPLVVDPVCASTSGTAFLSGSGLRALKTGLLPLATLVTPNRPEAELLSGIAIGSDRAAEAAALRILEAGCEAVLVKGGHSGSRVCRDCLAERGGVIRWFSSPRIRTENTHGTGCVLSAAIAFGLAQGLGTAESVDQAKEFLLEALVRGRRLRLGKGRGPAFAGVPVR